MPSELFFAREGYAVPATGYRPVGLGQLRQAADVHGMSERIMTAFARRQPALSDVSPRGGRGRPLPHVPVKHR
ncbi:hypothetical protein [Streptomyces sp. DG1A-41]|uniref:hypothetical protein n=1 Tax=Streptomyces sp. DG1A-41 TaxID=3125779 RepID=UPI0030CA958B